jgi:predicted transcriptional regulator
MVYNGLAKSDLIVFNILKDSDLSKPLPISRIAMLANYHYDTVRLALQRLETYEIVIRQRKLRGQPYRYSIKGNNYALLDA